MKSPPRLIASSLALLLAIACAPAPRPGPAPAAAPTGSGGTNSPAQRNKPYLVLVSFDGFRADYLDSLTPPNFELVAQRGARAVGMVPVFPSKTFPNHYTIVTGLYAEHHGIVANRFYDPARDEMYSLSDTAAVRDGSWYRGEPIWVTAEKQDMVAASFFWPGSEAAIEGIRPTISKHYDGSVPDSARVDSVLAWLRLPADERPHFVALYMSDVDGAGHRYGPQAPQVAAAVAKVDAMLGRLIRGIDGLTVGDSVYLVLVSDHGMARYTPAQFVALDEVIDTSGVLIAEAGPNANLHVSGGDARIRTLRDSLNRALTHGRAYLRADVPLPLHYSADQRIGDIVVIMDEPYQVGLASTRPRAPGGAHGWDPANEEMHGIFLIEGPGIRAGAELPLVPNVDVYSLMARLLRLDPAPVDGSPTRLFDLVTSP